MKIKTELPKVLYRYDLPEDRDNFVGAFEKDFELLVCSNDHDAERYIDTYGTEICAIVLDQELMNSALPVLCKKIKPEIISIQLHHDIALDAIVSLLDSGSTDKCFAKPYDINIVRSEIYTASIGLNAKVQVGSAEEVVDRKYSVLFVDDETIATKFLGKHLARLECPCDIKIADSAEHALQIFAEHKEDIAMIISDQRMPGMQGNQLLTEVQRYNPHIVRMLTSAYEEVDVALNAVNEGKIFRYIKKPWDAAEINSIIKLSLFEYKSRLSQASKQLASLNEQYDRILESRQGQIEEILREPVDNFVGKGMLQYFLNCLKTIHTVPPSKGALRASKVSNIENDLVHEFTQIVLDRLNQVSTGHTASAPDARSKEVLSTLSLLVEGDRNFEEIDSQDLNDEFILCLQSLLAHSELKLSDLEQLNEQELVTITTPQDVNVNAFKHMLSPHIQSTHIQSTQKMYQQQCDLLMLILLGQKLQIETLIHGGEHNFSLSLKFSKKVHPQPENPRS